MKNIDSPMKDVASKEALRTNRKAIESFDAYRELMENLDLARYPFGRNVTYRQMDASTTDSSINIYERVTTG